jgi:hypothetical protein
MFLPNNRGQLFRRMGNNLHGETQFASPQTVDCGVVRLMPKVETTSVRVDSSASRGMAEETTAKAKILFPAYVRIGQDDRFDIAGISLRCITVEPRYAIAGHLDHYECDFVVFPRSAR